jgi:hypothetical protein
MACFLAPDAPPVWVRFPSPAPPFVAWCVPALSKDAAHVVAQFPQHRRGYSVEFVLDDLVRSSSTEGVGAHCPHLGSRKSLCCSHCCTLQPISPATERTASKSSLPQHWRHHWTEVTMRISERTSLDAHRLCRPRCTSVRSRSAGTN